MNLNQEYLMAKVGSNVGIGYYDYITQLSTGTSLVLGNGDRKLMLSK